MFLFSVIGLSLLSLSMSATMTNAQTSSNFTLGTNSTGNETGVKQMGICVVGAGGPCNGDSNFDGKNDRTGQCILSNGCGNSSNSSNRTPQDKSPNTTSTANSKSNSSIMVDGLMLK